MWLEANAVSGYLYEPVMLPTITTDCNALTLDAIKYMLRNILLFFILFFGHRVFAQHEKLTLTQTDSNLIIRERPYQFRFGHFFKTNILYAILLDTSNDNEHNTTYCRVTFFEKVNNKWQKKNEFDSLPTSVGIKTRFCNYNSDAIEDYLVSADIDGTGGNETEHLFIFDNKTKTLRLIKGFENIPAKSYDAKSRIITSVGLAAGIPNFVYFKIEHFKLIEIGGKEMWSDNEYGYLEKYKMVDGKKVIYYKAKRKLPVDFYDW